MQSYQSREHFPIAGHLQSSCRFENVKRERNVGFRHRELRPASGFSRAGLVLIALPHRASQAGQGSRWDATLPRLAGYWNRYVCEYLQALIQDRLRWAVDQLKDDRMDEFAGKLKEGR